MMNKTVDKLFFFKVGVAKSNVMKMDNYVWCRYKVSVTSNAMHCELKIIVFSLTVCTWAP